jgi:hypothetical protein
MVKSTPVMREPAGGDPRGRIAEVTTPGPSPPAGLQPLPAPLMQAVRGSTLTEKLAVRVLTDVSMVVGKRIVGSTATWMLQVLKVGMFKTFTWYWRVVAAAWLA